MMGNTRQALTFLLMLLPGCTSLDAQTGFQNEPVTLCYLSQHEAEFKNKDFRLIATYATNREIAFFYDDNCKGRSYTAETVNVDIGKQFSEFLETSDLDAPGYARLDMTVRLSSRKLDQQGISTRGHLIVKKIWSGEKVKG